ncbi:MULTISPECIES: DUF441 domain-containing protein [Thermoanaerobacterium]|uniref:UPF0756 membrane protein V518_1682 n=2 Tax=Thermoanaerobacterium TaxID=28895 RepID=W9E8L3_9THEO|nr:MULTISPECIES: DUF441 family protein [Thermoanaerobacterium]AFK87146.1 UPF0756 membrane protein yeaL [Thermoanaerobacterium saccharolyticum JW/SL-YS485]ETO38147.1 hypothetical protein V518_1682 [Thermoanaerobacterium aotearoense SCUT27]
MDFGVLILSIMLFFSIIGKNDNVAAAILILLLTKLMNLEIINQFVSKNGMNLGIIVLTMGALSPLAMNKVSIGDFLNAAKSMEGVITIIAGIIVAVLASIGLNTMKVDANGVVGVLLGTVIGVSFFKGAPVGPMIALGITTILLRIFRL